MIFQLRLKLDIPLYEQYDQITKLNPLQNKSQKAASATPPDKHQEQLSAGHTHNLLIIPTKSGRAVTHTH
jgi:hypothetical protein